MKPQNLNNSNFEIEKLQRRALVLWEKDQSGAKALGKALIAVRDGMKHGAFLRWVDANGLDTNRVYYCLRLAEGKVIRQHPANPSTLAERFGAPPFSVLDAKQPYWLNRQRAWDALGIKGKQGRDDAYPAMGGGLQKLSGRTNISIFNPALAETVYEWFAPVGGGAILDPFAGGSTRGIVAAKLGHAYTGIELRAGLVEANRKQAEGIGVAPTWICGDSAQLSSYVPADKEFDLIFTSPPYFNQERYTAGDKRDGSRCKTYEEFIAWYENIFRQAVARLKQDRFLVVQVGEIRDEKGFYRNFVGDTYSCFLRLGLRYYDEIILAVPLGSCPIRDSRQFTRYRKVHKAHQNILCFWKGDNFKRIPTALGVLGAAESVPTEEAAVA